MAVWQSYDEVGIKEDVSDIITNISPTKTPFLSTLKTEKVHQRRHDWQEDSLAAQVTNNAAIEGANANYATLTPTTLRSNYTQILTKAIQVSGSADASLAHGRAKESAYQMSKKMEEAKRDLEATLTAVSAAYNAGNDTTARTMGNAENMVDSSTTDTLGSAGPLTEAAILTVMNDLYTAGGEADTLLIKPSDAQLVAAFATATGRERMLQNDYKTVTNVVNIYQTPYGDLKVVMDRFKNTSTAMLYDASYWRLLVFRNWFRTVLATTGDALNQMLIGEFSLKHLNFKASGLVANIT